LTLALPFATNSIKEPKMADDLVERLRKQMTPEQIEENKKKIRASTDAAIATPTDSVASTPTTPAPTAPSTLTDDINAKKRSRRIDNTVSDALSGIATPGR
jgi:hypothetical protein